MALIALLMGIALPAFAKARSQARNLMCQANLKGLMNGIHAYATSNDDTIVPSYNMHGVSGSRANPFDGWAPILEQGGFVAGNKTLKNNPFACPETRDVAGLAATNRGGSDDDPLGYMDWPAAVTFTGVHAITIPQRGFDRNIRVAYWINGDNPVGAPHSIEQGIHFTGSVGYGPDPEGRIMQPNRFHQIRVPARLIALADGIFAGNQHATRLGQKGLRIGYRHGGITPSAYVSIADGHVEVIASDKFPRKMDTGLSIEDVRRENLGTGPTVYAYPEKMLAGFP